MDELLSLKAELNHIRSTVDRSNPYMNRVVEELANEPVDRLREYVETILKKKLAKLKASTTSVYCGVYKINERWVLFSRV